MAAAPPSSASDIVDGPVLNLINKRIRALRKKLNRIAQMEESLSQGKVLNKEQEETYGSKSSVLAGIEELEKLRQPLAQAVDQEIQLAVEKNSPKSETLDVEENNGNDAVSIVSDLIKLIYFGSIFDVNTLMRAQENVLTRIHERSCCLTYDYVTDDDDAEPLKELDLDLIAGLGGLIISRPVDTGLSHMDALEKCVEHAKLWLENSEQAIEPDSGITYAGLREKLDKIMASEYFTTTPHIRAPVEVAAAAENYAQFQVHGSVIPVNETVQLEGSAVQYQQEEEESPSHDNSFYDEQTGPVQEHQEEAPEVNHASQVEAQIEQSTHEKEEDQNPKNNNNADLKENNGTNRRSHSNYKGGRGGPRRGYSNGRGGRRGGYQNENGQSYGQDGNNYYSRNNYGYRGRGGRGMSGNYNYYNDAAATS